MSTRSMVGYVEGATVHDGMVNGGTVHAVYVHHDGYPSYNGAMLLEHYTEIEKIKALVALGGMSSLHPTVEECLPDSYHVWQREDIEISEDSLDEFLKRVSEDCWIEYAYLFVNGQWYYFENEPILVPLTKKRCEDD